MIVFGFIVIYRVMSMSALDKVFVRVIERNDRKGTQNAYHFRAFRPQKVFCSTF